MIRLSQRLALVTTCTVLAACAKEPETSDVTVSITSPAEGDTVSGSAVHITLEATGIEIAPAADARPETAHHHLYLDVDFPQVETSIPMGVGGVVHLGQAQKEYHWENVAPGPHRLIAVLADPGHFPLRPWVTDTVNFVVRAPADTATK
jgi:Domain of unknown function (DUF4399)